MTEQTEQEPIDPIAQCIRWLSFMVVNQEDRRMVQAELESIAAHLRERDAQIANMGANQLVLQEAVATQSDLIVTLRAERDAAEQELAYQKRWTTSLAEYLAYNHGSHESDAAWNEFLEKEHEKPPVHGCECARVNAALQSTRPQEQP